MAEFVRVDALHVCASTQAVDQDAQPAAVEGLVGVANEERRIRIFPILTRRQVAPDGLPGHFAWFINQGQP